MDTEDLGRFVKFGLFPDRSGEEVELKLLGVIVELFPSF